MVDDQTYLCEACNAKRHRSYSVPYFLKTCANGCGFRRFIRSELLDSMAAVPESIRPGNWDQLSLQQKLIIAAKADSPK